jgi:purine-nucleoside phosphorylase
MTALRAEETVVRDLARALEARGAGGAQLAIVLGSGLGGFADRLERAVAIPFAELSGMPRSSVPGHAGRMVVGELRGVRVLVQQGRIHLYEGAGPHAIARSIRAIAETGCRSLVLTNAAGGLRREWSPPTLMRITDHIDLQGATPLAASEAGLGSPYDEGLGEALERGARDADVALERGVYAGLVGPSYETPAEIRMLDWMGADAVGMSTVCEAQAGRAAGMRVAGISCIANHAAGIATRPLLHTEVLEAAAAVAERFARLLEHAIPHLS